MTVTALVHKAIPIAILSLFLSSPAMAQGVGAIGGTVQDATGGALPGVNVSLSNPGVIGGNQQTVTDARGAYQFARLVPGSTYTVRAELSGFGTATGNGIVVNADTTTRLDLTLQLAGVAETLTVSGISPLVDTTTVREQTVLETETLGLLPTGRDLWTAARLVPAVLMNKYDVGGTGSLLQSSATIHGSLGTENRYYVDGQDVSAINAAGAANSYFDTSMFQEYNLQTGNAPAESQMGGVVYNLVTKTGTNVVRGSVSYTGTQSGLQAKNVTPALRQQLLAGVPARALQANPNLDPSGQILKFYNIEGSVSGPIARDRFWFMGSANLKPLDQLKLGSYNSDGTQFVDDNRQWNYGFKLSWEATPGNQVHYTQQTSHRTAYHRVVDASAFYESRAAGLQELGFMVNTVKWTSVLSPRLVMDISAGGYHGITPFHQRPEIQKGDLPQWDSLTNTYTVARESYDETFPGTINVNASVAYVAGNHDLKFGYQPAYLWVKSDTWSTSHYPSGLLAIFRNGVPNSVRISNTPVSVASYTFDHGIFVQDSWRATRRLTLNLGLRLQKTNGWIPAQCRVQTIFVDEQCFPKIENEPDWLDLAPRFGLIYDLFGNGKTALKVALNRYYLAEGPNHPARVNPLRGPDQALTGVGTESRPWSDLNNDRVPQLNELGPSTGFNIGATNRYNQDLKRPYTNELNVSLEQQLGNIGVVAGYYHRETLRTLGSRNLAVPLESYTPLTVTERASGQTVTVYSQDPATRGRFDVLIDNAPELASQFDGVDLTVTKRLSGGWMILGGLALGRSTGDTYGISTDLNNPNNTFRIGRVRDVPVSFKMAGIYGLPYGLSVSGNVQYYSGFAESDTVRVASDTVVLTQVAQTVRIAPQGTNRLPGVSLVDFGARRAFKIRHVAIDPVIEVFNLANANTITGRSTLLGPTYHRVTGILSGRLVRFGFDVKF